MNCAGFGVRQFGPSNNAPSTLHCLVTTKCDLCCEGCFYRNGPDGSWTWEYAEKVALHAEAMQVDWIAIGGGEPTQWPYLNDWCTLLRNRMHINVSVTTNGVKLRPIHANAVHLSYDRRHVDQWPGSALSNHVDVVLGKLQYYRDFGCDVGINTVLTDADFLDEKVLKAVKTVVLTLDKPVDPKMNIRGLFDTANNRLYRHTAVCIDSCLAQYLHGDCAQGRTSMAIDHLGRYSACSNISRKAAAPGVITGWGQVRCYSDDLPRGCLMAKKKEPDSDTG